MRIGEQSYTSNSHPVYVPQHQNTGGQENMVLYGDHYHQEYNEGQHQAENIPLNRDSNNITRIGGAGGEPQQRRPEVHVQTGGNFIYLFILNKKVIFQI